MAMASFCWVNGMRSGPTHQNRSGASRPRMREQDALATAREMPRLHSLSNTMKIEAITLREIHMPLVHFFETSFGRTYSRRILLVTIHSEGADGWGESVVGEDPFYSSEWIESAWPTLKQYLIPALL